MISVAWYVLLLLLAAGILAGLAIAASVAEKDEKERLAKEERARASADAARELELNAWNTRLAKLEADSQLRAETTAQTIIERAMGFAQARKKERNTYPGFAEVDDALRVLLLKRLFRGKLITISYLASPAGRIALEWVVTDTRFESPRVKVRKNGFLLMDDIGTANQWAGQMDRGTSAEFMIVLLNGERELEDVVFTLHIPSASQWTEAVKSPPPAISTATAAASVAKKPSKSPSALEREVTAEIDQLATLRKVKGKVYKRIEKSAGLSEEDKEAFKADVDGVVAKVRDKYES